MQCPECQHENSVRAGLEILDAMDRLRARVQREWGLPLAVRLGIHTGFVVVGEVGGHWPAVLLCADSSRVSA